MFSHDLDILVCLGEYTVYMLYCRNSKGWMLVCNSAHTVAILSIKMYPYEICRNGDVTKLLSHKIPFSVIALFAVV